MKKQDAISNLLNITMKASLSEDIEIKIQRLEEFEFLIPPLSNDEFVQLEQNILAEGCREPLIVWHNLDENAYVLVDGHNRFHICTKFGIKFKTKISYFESKEDAKQWMINNQLGRRNLSVLQASFLRGKRYESEKMKSGQRTDLSQNLGKVEHTHERLAKEYSVSKNTITNDAIFAKAIDKIGEVNPELKRNILSGKTKINKSQVQELAKIENLPMLEDIENLENLFQTDKIEVFDQLKTKKDHLVKIIKNTDFDLMSLEQIEKFCLDLVPKK